MPFWILLHKGNRNSKQKKLKRNRKSTNNSLTMMKLIRIIFSNKGIFQINNSKNLAKAILKNQFKRN